MDIVKSAALKILQKQTRKSKQDATQKDIDNMQGGKRTGAGRKRSDSKKIRVSYSLAPDVVEYLSSRTDKPKAQIIEDALRNERTKQQNIPPTAIID